MAMLGLAALRVCWYIGNMFPLGYMSDTGVTTRETHFQSYPRGPPGGAMDFYKETLVEEIAKNEAEAR